MVTAEQVLEAKSLPQGRVIASEISYDYFYTWIMFKLPKIHSLEFLLVKVYLS